MLRPFKLCVVTSSFPLHPADTIQAPFLLDFIERLVNDGFEITVFTHDRPGNPYFDWKGFRVRYFGWRERDLRLSEISLCSLSGISDVCSLLFHGTRSLGALQRAERFNGFLCCWAVPAGVYVWLNRLWNKTFPPYAVWALGSDINALKKNLPGRFLLKRVLRGAGNLLADGFELSEEVKRLGRKDCQFIATSRTLSPAPPVVEKSDESTTQFLYVGRHERVKGVDSLVEAVMLARDRAKAPFRLVMLGEGPLTPELKARVHAQGAGEIVRFEGRVSAEQLAGFYQSSHCVVIPSRSESIPLVLGEAIACGKALIVTEVGDMGRLVRDYHLGTVVPKEDPPALAEALLGFLTRPSAPAHDDCARLIDLLSQKNSATRLASTLREMVFVPSNEGSNP